MEHIIEKSAIGCFEQDLFEQERAQETIGRYRKQIVAFSEWIAEKPVTKDLVVQYKQLLIKSYSPASVNVALAALNGFFKFMGWEECKVRPVRVQRRHYAEPQRELTCQEYYRLLNAAQQKGDLRLFHLIETICSTGIRVSE